MTDDRTAILGRIAKSLNRVEEVDNLEEAFATLTRQKKQAVQPRTVQPHHAESVEEAFVHAARQSAAQVYTINTLDEFGAWLEQRVSEEPQRPGVVLAPNVRDLSDQLTAFDTTENNQRPANWGIVRAWAGIAETGTVVSLTQDCPAGMLFLVERLIVILNSKDIIAYQEDVWQKLRGRCGVNLPRAVNLITGPSRTADVEQTIQLGAHGPRWVDYVLVP